MEYLLKHLFDYQRFQPNLRLAEIIADTEERYAQTNSQMGRSDAEVKVIGKNMNTCSFAEEKDNKIQPLSDTDLELVNAAGELPIPGRPEEYRDD